MVYLYGNENCLNCIKKEEEFKKQGTQYVKRDSSRMKAPEDSIDQEALVVASMQNMTLPVVVESL